MPTVTICTEVFAEMAHLEATGLGMPDLPVVVIPHPLFDRSAGQLRAIAASIAPAVAAALQRRE